MIAADNTLWRGEVLKHDGTDEETPAIQRFNDYVSEQSDLIWFYFLPVTARCWSVGPPSV